MHVKDIAEVTAGYAFRGAIEPDDNGDIYVFQAKNVSTRTSFNDLSLLTKISHDIPEYAGHLEKNDILLVARGMKSGTFRATVFASNSDNVVASSSIHVIRVTSTKIMPEYLAYYLNSKRGQDALSQIVSGSYIGAIPRSELEKILIPVPSIQKQHLLVDLHLNVRKQQQLMERKMELEQDIINTVFRRAMV